MKNLLLLVLISLCVSVQGQEKKLQSRFNRLKSIKGTEFVIASIDNYGKFIKTDESLIIINSKTGQITPVTFPQKINVVKIKQVRIDSLDVNCLVVTAQIIENNLSLFEIQTRLFIVSTDGRTVKEITDNDYYTIDWVVNKKAGSLVITGQSDVNNNGRIDSYDKNEIMIFDLKTLRRIVYN